MLARELARIVPLLAAGEFMQVYWPKKAAAKLRGVSADVGEDVIREVCLPVGPVDATACAIDAVWSGLKLMVR